MTDPLTDAEHAAWEHARRDSIPFLDFRKQLDEVLVLVGEQSASAAAASVLPYFERTEALVTRRFDELAAQLRAFMQTVSDQLAEHERRITKLERRIEALADRRMFEDGQ